jgi:hypothetical protein
MRDVADYSRFTEDVCALNNWPSLSDTVEAALKQIGSPEKDYADMLFAIWLKTRKSHPFAFLNPRIWCTEWPSKEAQVYLSHPVMEFANKTLFHFDRNFQESMMFGYVIECYMRILLLSTSRTVQLPYSASEGALDRLLELITANFESIGIKVPSVILKSKPRVSLEDSA